MKSSNFSRKRVEESRSHSIHIKLQHTSSQQDLCSPSILVNYKFRPSFVVPRRHHNTQGQPSCDLHSYRGCTAASTSWCRWFWNRYRLGVIVVVRDAAQVSHAKGKWPSAHTRRCPASVRIRDNTVNLGPQRILFISKKWDHFPSWGWLQVRQTCRSNVIVYGVVQTTAAAAAAGQRWVLIGLYEAKTDRGERRKGNSASFS